VGCTRGHDLKLFKTSCRLNCRKFSFSPRVIDVWNKLASSVVACSTVTNFKHRVDILMLVMGSKKSIDFLPFSY
jgi:hypothetical protein